MADRKYGYDRFDVGVDTPDYDPTKDLKNTGSIGESFEGLKSSMAAYGDRIERDRVEANNMQASELNFQMSKMSESELNDFDVRGQGMSAENLNSLTNSSMQYKQTLLENNRYAQEKEENAIQQRVDNKYKEATLAQDIARDTQTNLVAIKNAGANVTRSNATAASQRAQTRIAESNHQTSQNDKAIQAEIDNGTEWVTNPTTKKSVRVVKDGVTFSTGAQTALRSQNNIRMAAQVAETNTIKKKTEQTNSIANNKAKLAQNKADAEGFTYEDVKETLSTYDNPDNDVAAYITNLKGLPRSLAAQMMQHVEGGAFTDSVDMDAAKKTLAEYNRKKGKPKGTSEEADLITKLQAKIAELTKDTTSKKNKIRSPKGSR